MINGISSSGSNPTAAQKLATLVPARDPEQAKKDKEIQSTLHQTLQAMKNSNNDMAKQRKSMAASRVAQIKAQIKALKQAAAMDPKATARMIARLVKQLAQALKDYAAAGATYTETSAGSSGTTATPAKTSSADPAAQDNGADSGSESAEMDASASMPPEATDIPPDMDSENADQEQDSVFATGSKAYEQTQNRKADDDRNKNDDSNSNDSGTVKTIRKKDDDSAFIKDAKDLLDELRNFLKLQKARMGNQKNRLGEKDEIALAEKAIKDAERQFQAMTRAVSAPVNVVS